jgi:cytochrome c oxidase cbb3-type subunit 3
MTRNLTIATLFLLGCTLLLGYIWVRENGVLTARAERFDGALVTRGAHDYEQYCASCHGLTGEGGVNAGAPSLNNLPARLQEQNRLDGPTGITAKYGTILNFVQATVSSGVKGTAMPRWSARFGGPLRDDQIVNIATYVSKWWDTQIPADAQQVAAEFKATQEAILLSAAASNTPVGRGQALFGQCSSCHNLNDKDSGVPAPGLGDLFGPDGTAAFGKTLPNGKPVTPADFFEWVKKGGAAFAAQEVKPSAGHGPYVIAAMPGFPTLTDQQLADLLAFISTHDRSGEQKLPPIGPDGKPLPEQPGGTPGAAPAGTPLTTPAAPGAQPNTAPGGSSGPTPTP